MPIMTTGELIKILADYSPDTPVKLLNTDRGNHYVDVDATDYDDTDCVFVILQ